MDTVALPPLKSWISLPLLSKYAWNGLAEANCFNDSCWVAFSFVVCVSSTTSLMELPSACSETADNAAPSSSIVAFVILIFTLSTLLSAFTASVSFSTVFSESWTEVTSDFACDTSMVMDVFSLAPVLSPPPELLPLSTILSISDCVISLTTAVPFEIFVVTFTVFSLDTGTV